MPRHKFHVFVERGVWRIAWDDDEGCPGRYLGDDREEDVQGGSSVKHAHPFEVQPRSQDLDEDKILWEIWTVDRTIALTKAKHDTSGFWWDEEKPARAALKLAKEALKQEREMPEWARIALQQGWKPPKGWKA
jgi:hypothetical protein